MGFSITVVLASTIVTSGFAIGTCSLIAFSVISANGVEYRDTEGDGAAGGAIGLGDTPTVASGSGDTVGSGVGNATEASVASSATDIRAFRFARTPTLPPVVRFLGEAFLTGDGGSEGALLSGGLNIWDGSTESLARARRVRVAVRGVEATSAVLRLVD